MNDESFMQEALKVSEQRIRSENSPFAAVVVKDGKVISRAHNTVVTETDPTAHAEMTAIRRACKDLGRFHLEDCTLYTTNEPCPMCFFSRVMTKSQMRFAGSLLRQK